MNINNNSNQQFTEEEADVPFSIGGIVEKGMDENKKKKPAALKPMMNSSKKLQKNNNNTGTTTTNGSLRDDIASSSSVTSFPKPDPTKRYTTRPMVEETTTYTTSSTNNNIGGFSQKPINQNMRAGNQQQQQSVAPPAVNERPIETSEFLQILRQTMTQQQQQSTNNKNEETTNNNNALPKGSPLVFDAGSRESLPDANDREKISSTSMETILRVARSAVPAQRAAALRSLQVRCENTPLKEKTHDFFINAPADVANSLFHADESGPRLAMLAHLAYEDANQTVRESALLMWLTILSCGERDDDILDTLVLAAVTGAPTDEGDDSSNGTGLVIDEDSEEQRKIDEEELKKRRQLAGGDTVPREMDDVDLRCGPTGITVERRYFTLEAVTKLLRKDPALGLARLGVYRTLLDRAVGRAADHDPAGSSLNPIVGDSTLLDNRDLWRAIAIASHESSTCAAYICEHKSFFVAFQLLIQACIGAHRGREIPTKKLGTDLLPCVRDGFIAILSAIHSNSARAHRMLPKLWGEGGVFLLLKYLETVFEETTAQQQESEGSDQQQQHVDPTTRTSSTKFHHCAADHFTPSSKNSKTKSNINNNGPYPSQCCALLCCIIRSAVRFGVRLSSEALPFEEAEIRETLAQKDLIEKNSTKKNKGNNNKSSSSSVSFSEKKEVEEGKKQSASTAQEEVDPEIQTWFAEVYSFLVFTARHVGSFAVLEMLLLNEVNNSTTTKLKPIFVRQHDKKEGDESSSSSGDDDDDENIRFVKTDLKRTVDEIVFPCVTKALDSLLFPDYENEEDQSDEENSSIIDLAVTTGTHLLATWIGEGSLVAVFYGDRDDAQLLTKIEPLLDKSLKVLYHHVIGGGSSNQESDNNNNNNNNDRNATNQGCIVSDAFAHGLARIVDVIVRCYPKVTGKVAFHLQEIFSLLITLPTESSVFRVGNNDAKSNFGEEDVDVLLRQTKEMVAEILGTNNNKNSDKSNKSQTASFTSKEASLSRLTRLSAIGELLRTAEWMINNNNNNSNNNNNNDKDKVENQQQQQQQLPSVVIRTEVVSCVAFNLVRVAMRCRGAADTALSAGLALLLPMKDSDSSSIDMLRENLANSLIDITSSPQPKVTHSLPVSLRLDPLSSWLLNPSMFSPTKVKDTDDEDEKDNDKKKVEAGVDVETFISEAEATLVRISWAQWMAEMMTRISTISSSIASPIASIQIQSLLPHPLSVLSASFLAAFCNEDPRELPPKFFTSSPRARKAFEHIAVTSFTLCCLRDDASSSKRCKEHLRQLRKEAVETICRCAGQNGDCIEMLILITVAVLLRGSPDCWSPILNLWLERANWLLGAQQIVQKSALLRSLFSSPVVVLPMISSSSLSTATNTTSTDNTNNENKVVGTTKATKLSPLLLTKTETQALQYASEIVESLSTAAQFLPPDESAGASQLPLFVKAALSSIAELSAPCSDFVKSNILQLVEERLWIGADETVKMLQETVLAENGKRGASDFWVKDLLVV